MKIINYEAENHQINIKDEERPITSNFPMSSVQFSPSEWQAHTFTDSFQVS